MATAGMQALGAATLPFTAWPGQALVFETPQSEAAATARPHEAALEAKLPAWAGRAPAWQPAALPAEPVPPRPLAPSRPEGAELGPVPPARSPLVPRIGPSRFGRGLAMHALLQHLPDLPEDVRAVAAEEYAARAAHGVADPAALAAQALAVLQTPGLAALFGPGSRAEQPISGLVGTQIVAGQVDRLAVLADCVLIADYKTNRAPPKVPEAAPVLYLRQMAAYRAVLGRLYPGREIVCLLIWTEGPEVMRLPASLLDRHAPGAARLLVADECA
jgi:ATP-dependent helicase/nuclease subunit A